MSAPNNNLPAGIFTIVLIVFLVWFFADGRPFFRHTGRDVKETVQDVGHDIKQSGRDVASSIRHDVQ